MRWDFSAWGEVRTANETPGITLPIAPKTLAYVPKAIRGTFRGRMRRLVCWVNGP